MALKDIITVTLGKITKDGKVCSNPSVKLVGYPNVYINCIDEAKGIYKFQLPENEEPKCLYFEVDCNEDGDCINCDAEIIQKCFCDDKGDCPACNECDSEGFCNPLCDPEYCYNGECSDCTTSTQCPCNQTCTNGDCGCPTGKFLDSDGVCCIECDANTPCDACEVCNNGTCEPKDCGEGICNPQTNTCVDCITADQCGDNECCNGNSCECCSGYVWDSCVEKCIPLPSNPCSSESDCDACSDCKNYNPCTGIGVCTPVQCPSGKVCLDGDCIEECDCDDPGCSKKTQYCKDINGDDCGCVDCEGSCSTGCLAPCYCNPKTNRCEYNPCSGGCINGLDCGEDCGCTQEEVCQPCSTLSCADNSCDQTLGCECKNDGSCGPVSDCGYASCSIADDCGEGCTCYKGRCVSCDNFSCDNGECDVQDGCACQGSVCAGDDDDDCSDSIEIEKNDSNCTLVGRLTKDNCCQCPVLTLDSKGKISSESSTAYAISFIAEVRKGNYDGISVDSIPRVDDTANDKIADNEAPVSGTISLTKKIKYDVFDVSSGSRVYVSTTTVTPTGSESTFPESGDKAQVEFNNISFPKIGSEEQNGNQIRVVTQVEFEFSLTNTMDFPSDCSYKGGSFAKYTIRNNSDYTAFGSTYGNAKGDIIQSSDCRLPLFKWTKSKDSTYNESPFRKVYVEGSNGVYEDTVTFDDGLESCYYYSLDTDCTCDEPKSKYIVFCNPKDLDIEFTPNTCNKCFTINSFDVCDVNKLVNFQITAGSIKLSFKGSEASSIIGKEYCSTTSIENVEYKIVCDSLGVCTKNYKVPSTDLQITPTTECDPDNLEFVVSFPSTDDGNNCAVTKVEIGGHTLTSILS